MTASRHLRRAQATLLAGALGAGLGVATPAYADDISADAAQHLEQQLHDWLAALLGPHADIGDRPLHITADADHYRLEWPIAGALGAVGVTVEADPVTANLKPLDGGRWAIDDVRAPSPLHVSFPVPGGGDGDSAATGRTTITVASQDQHAVLDPSLASPSHWDTTLKGYSSKTEGLKEGGTQSMTIEDMTMHMAWDPAADGRLNVTEDSDSHLIASNAVMPDVGPVSFSIERMHGTLKLDGVAPDRVAPLLHAVMDLVPAGIAAAKHAEAGGADQKSLHALAEQNRAAAEQDRQAADADKLAVTQGRMTPAQRKKNTEARLARAKARRAAMLTERTEPAAAPAAFSPEQRTAAHDALVALADLIGGFEEQGSMENLHVVAAGHSGRLKKLALGFAAGAPDGKVAIRFNLAMDGLDSPDIPPGVFRDYLPRHMSIAPRLSGVSSADLRDLLLHAADSNGDDPQLEAQAMALLGKGPIALGLDEVSFDFGPATLQGKGEVRVLDPERYEGEAHFTATGLDDLIKKANTVPELAQAAPVLFLVKGMGKQEGANTVWDVTYRDNKVLVNGNDLSQMLPGGGK